MTQLIPKTKIPAHTRYALQCRFSPDSTCVLGSWGEGAYAGAGDTTWCVVSGYRVVVAAEIPNVQPQAPCYLFS